jgi:hypothetical protein
MPREVAAAECSPLTLGRMRAIERGAPASPEEREQHPEAYKLLELIVAPAVAEFCRQLEAIGPDALAAASEVQRRWPELTPSQRRRFEKVKIRHAPRILRLLPRQAAIHVPERRENVTARPREHRSRSRTRSTARGDPDPEPEPPLRVIPLAAFRRELRRALEARPA